MTRLGSLAFLLLLPGGPAAAASINYGDFDDIPPGTVMFLGVTEGSGTDPVPLFGSPLVLGNMLDFDPSGFAASTGGGGADITDGQLNFQVMSIPGSSIDQITIDESGDFSLFGAGTAATQVAFGLFMQLTILEVDGALISPFDVIVSAEGSFDLVTNPGLSQPWDLSLMADLDQELIDEGIAFELGVTKADVVLDDTLIAISEAASAAFIAKKAFRIAVVPEPATLILGLLGVLLAVRSRNRR